MAETMERYEALCARLQSGRSHSADDWRQMLILLRFLIRAELEDRREADDDLRFLRRKKRLLEREQIHFALLDARLAQAAGAQKRVQGNLAALGELAAVLLDNWQSAGATRGELLALCGVHHLRDREQVRWDEERQDSPFSCLVFAYHLDYPHSKEEWIQDDVDAPFTHALLEAVLNQMLHTEAGRQASREALAQTFPDLLPIDLQN